MQADFKVLLDACVLANFSVCDLYLNLAKRPRLYLPRWSDEILQEVRRVHLEKFKPPWPVRLADSWQQAVQESFPEASVNDYGHLIPELSNHPKDRHVLGAAIRAGADVIVTFNLKDFKQSALEPWGIEAVHPQDYLITLYSMSPEVVVLKLHEIAQNRNRDLEEVLLRLGKSLPNFVSLLIDDLELTM